ncbi:MAG: polysaccharide deacetylase family protein [Ruminococcus sp.]|nr:polysaccharide deacetylase family protein [Ruminococcus sp.]
MYNRYKVYRYDSFSKKRKKKKVVLIIAIAVLVLAIIGAVGFVVFKNGFDSVENLKASERTDKSISLKWDIKDGADSYNVYWKTADGDYSKAEHLKENTYTVKKLKQATEYRLYVAAVKDDYELTKSGEITSYTVAEKPNVKEAENDEKGTVKIKWDKNPAAVSYVVQYKNLTDSKYPRKNSQKVKKSPKPQATITDLKPGVVYDVRVCAVTYNNGEKDYGVWNESRFTAFREKRVIDPDKPMIALTFDDGPGNGNSGDRILDILEKNNAKATFFMIGNRAVERPDNVMRKAELGMELGNHSWDHKKYDKQIKKEDIKKCSDAIMEITGQYPTAFRPPGGLSTKFIEKECANENMPLCLWNVDTQDWSSRNPSAIYKSVVNSVSDGDIVLMHEIYDSTADALKLIVPRLIKDGYQLVTFTELITAKTGEAPEAGVLYYNG